MQGKLLRPDVSLVQKYPSIPRIQSFLWDNSMNILPTSPDTTSTPAQLEQYFRDMERWNFTIPYNAFYAFPLADTRALFRRPYEDFVRMAHDRGYPACVQVQSTVGFLDDVGIENAQYNTDNSVYLYQHFLRYGKKNFFGSFAAPGWLAYLKTITEILRSFGFDWVVFEEPMFRNDIPGTKDKLFDRFQDAWPDMPYPTHQEESVPYMNLQELKADVLVDFYRRLTEYARTIGFEKCGIMPWFFVPTFENTPMETWNTCCHLGRLTFLPEVDFIVVRMQPDNVYSQATIASCGEGIPQISYLETLAQNLGKPVISVNNPTNEHIKLSADTPNNLLPYSFFARFTLAAAAAAPCGMSRHWYKKDYDNDQTHMELLARVNRCLPRLGSPASPAALVFSYTAMNRTVPRPWTESWKSFWFLAHDLLYQEKYPVLTFFADTLADSLCRHPETRLLIFHELFPVSAKETRLVEEWLEEDASRRILFIGSGCGYRQDLDALYHAFEPLPSEILRLFGVDMARPVATFSDGLEVCLQSAGLVDSEAPIGFNPTLRCPSWGAPELRDKASADILYTAGQEQRPVVFLRRFPSGAQALYAGLSTDGFCNDLPMRRLVDFLLKKTPLPTDGNNGDAPPFPVQTRSTGLFWSRTQNGFFMLSNTSAEPARCKIAGNGGALWNVLGESWIENSLDVVVPPMDFLCLRQVNNGDCLLDIEGQVYLTAVSMSAETLSVTGLFQRRLVLKLRREPVSVSLRGKPVNYQLQSAPYGSMIIMNMDKPGEGLLEIRFKA